MNRESRVDCVAMSDVAGEIGRWTSVGWSRDSDPAAAGYAAASAALSRADPKVLIAFCAASHDPARLLSGLATAAGSVPLVGCSTDVVITPEGPLPDGVAVVALGGPDFTVATAAASVTGGRHRAAGAAVAECFHEVGHLPHRILLMLTDGYSIDQEVIIAGAYGVVGASLPLVGGSAGARAVGERTFQLRDGDLLNDAVIGVAIGSSAPLGLGLRHGWRRTGEPLVVTHSVDGIVKTLNDQPALATYLSRHGGPPEAYHDPAAFKAFARTRPIGISRRVGEAVRDVSSFDYLAEGWLRSHSDVPEGGLVWLMEGDSGSVLGAAGDAVSDAVQGLGGTAPLGLIAFDCFARSGILGPDGIRAEVAQMTRDGLPVAGMYTWGEIARSRGINAYHNLTLAVLALG